jgi:hexosaminidase
MIDVDYMVFPRLLALAEVAWSPPAGRTATSAAHHDFLRRLAAQGARLQAAGINFYPSPEVNWHLTAEGAALHASSRGQVSATVAALSAPGFPTSTLSMCDSSLGIGCTISWGDGITSTGDVTGTNATDTRVNSLYGTVTLSAGNAKPVTAGFTVAWP